MNDRHDWIKLQPGEVTALVRLLKHPSHANHEIILSRLPGDALVTVKAGDKSYWLDPGTGKAERYI